MPDTRRPAPDGPDRDGGRARPTRPAGRYGDRADDRAGGRSGASRLRPGPVAAAVVAATLLVGWVVWAGLGAATPDVRSNVVSFVVPRDTLIRARIEVTADARRAVRCTVEAQDRTHAPAGVAAVTVPAGPDRTRQVTVAVRTRSRPVTAVIQECHLVTRRTG